jgi:hypothetical protein
MTHELATVAFRARRVGSAHQERRCWAVRTLRLLPALLVLSAPTPSQAAPGDITTVAGGVGQGPALSIAQEPAGVAVSGFFVYVADASNSVVRRIDTRTGIEIVIAGNGTAGFSGDGGPAISAQLSPSYGVAVDAAGNLFIADARNNRIRMVEASTPSCAGDCSNDGQVTIDELITLVNIALGNAQPSACPHGVPSGAEVNVALIIQAVNNALTDCGGG